MGRPKKTEHKDTSLSLAPLTFDEAISVLAKSPKHEDSQAEASGNTKEACPGSETSKKQTFPHPESSDD